MATLTVLPGQDSQGRTAELPLAEGDILLERLLGHGVALAHDCGGTLACASCCIIVRKGLETLSRASEDEQEMLDRVAHSEPGSRLACQTIGGDGDVVIEIPRAEGPRTAAQLQATAREIRLTASAAQHFARQLIKGPASLGVRLAVVPAGCSGYRYSVDHAGAIDAQDTIFESRGIRIVVDLNSLPYVQGTTVDVVQEGLARRLRFDNPNAARTCGCGESFGT